MLAATPNLGRINGTRNTVENASQRTPGEIIFRIFGHHEVYVAYDLLVGNIFMALCGYENGKKSNKIWKWTFAFERLPR